MGSWQGSPAGIRSYSLEALSAICFNPFLADLAIVFFKIRSCFIGQQPGKAGARMKGSLMNKTDRTHSTTYSSQRFAHPFFLPAPPDKREVFNGLSRMIDWSKQNLGPVFPTVGDGAIALSDVIGKSGTTEIENLGEIR